MEPDDPPHYADVRSREKSLMEIRKSAFINAWLWKESQKPVVHSQ
jgi:hypothetical protein